MIVSNGMPPPQPWDIVAQPMVMFKDEVRLIEIPNTAQVEVILIGCFIALFSKICFLQ